MNRVIYDSAIIIWNGYFKFVITTVFKECLFFQDKMEEEDIRTTVELYIYDLTKGMAAMMSPILIGKRKKLSTILTFTESIFLT